MKQSKLSFSQAGTENLKTEIKSSMKRIRRRDTRQFFHSIKNGVLKPLDPQNIRRQAKAAYDWLDKVTEGFISERLKHRKSNVERFGDMLDSLLDYSEDNEADFNLIHIKTLLVVDPPSFTCL
ncbi:hypothetical protein L1887_29057 [Cichorium endivia]|nr:hypothetical protein L1887_29057 [Cichorium endivia]